VVSESAPSALITGGSRGIGYGIATHLARKGWTLTLCARDAKRLDVVAAQLEDLGARVTTIAGDLADEHAATAALRRHQDATLTLNALILAAGVGSAAPLDGYPMRRFDKQLAVNLRTPFALISEAVPMLRAGAAALPEHGGRVIALTSLEGVYPEAGLSAYAASKAALISLTQSINVEEGIHGVTASAISPGFVDTDMSAWVADTIPPDTMIPVEDIVRVVDLLLSVSTRSVLPHIVINRTGTNPYHA
jgi:3-oxoacyl-[acyl-carrier protein] reductase